MTRAALVAPVRTAAGCDPATMSWDDRDRLNVGRVDYGGLRIGRDGGREHVHAIT